jgi:hypothetical protein
VNDDLLKNLREVNEGYVRTGSNDVFCVDLFAIPIFRIRVPWQTRHEMGVITFLSAASSSDPGPWPSAPLVAEYPLGPRMQIDMVEDAKPGSDRGGSPSRHPDAVLHPVVSLFFFIARHPVNPKGVEDRAFLHEGRIKVGEVTAAFKKLVRMELITQQVNEGQNELTRRFLSRRLLYASLASRTAGS